MFSSNQILKISGRLNEKDIMAALDTAFLFNGLVESEFNDKIIYQVSQGGYFCIGSIKFAEDEIIGWKDFSFDAIINENKNHNLNLTKRMIALHIIDYLDKCDYTDEFKEYSDAAGSRYKGFLMEPIMEYYEDTMDEQYKIKKPSYGIVSFKPYVCFYAK